MKLKHKYNASRYPSVVQKKIIGIARSWGLGDRKLNWHTSDYIELINGRYNMNHRNFKASFKQKRDGLTWSVVEREKIVLNTFILVD